jgi:hypothetical protein
LQGDYGFEKMKKPPLTEPREIRKAMRDAIRRGERIGGGDTSQFGFNGATALARNIIAMCEFKGYSGEDTMTVLAYHALLRNEKSDDELLNMLNMTACPPFIIDIEDLKR